MEEKIYEEILFFIYHYCPFYNLTACDDGNIDPGIEDELKGRSFSITIEDVQEWVSVDKTSAMENEIVTISVTIPQGKRS